jgi:hypothetical protein
VRSCSDDLCLDFHDTSSMSSACIPHSKHPSFAKKIEVPVGTGKKAAFRIFARETERS